MTQTIFIQPPSSLAQTSKKWACWWGQNRTGRWFTPLMLLLTLVGIAPPFPIAFHHWQAQPMWAQVHQFILTTEEVLSLTQIFPKRLFPSTVRLLTRQKASSSFWVLLSTTFSIATLVILDCLAQVRAKTTLASFSSSMIRAEFRVKFSACISIVILLCNQAPCSLEGMTQLIWKHQHWAFNTYHWWMIQVSGLLRLVQFELACQETSAGPSLLQGMLW